MTDTKVKKEIDVRESAHNGIPVVKLQNIAPFSAEKTFDCGQSFRFGKASDGAIEGVAHARFVRFIQNDPDSLIIENTTADEFERLWRHYLGLDLDYRGITRRLLETPDADILAPAAKVAEGIRILNQEPWECLCSFIVSQNNNIPRISKIIDSLCRECGERIDTPWGEKFAFPTPEATASLGVDGLFALRTGFRAKYIYDAARRVACGETDLEAIRALSTDEAAAELCKIHGVGIKVASCAMLFSLEKYDAFPIDVWVRRLLEKYFPPDFNPKSFGEYAGIAEQYLFYYERYIVGR